MSIIDRHNVTLNVMAKRLVHRPTSQFLLFFIISTVMEYEGKE